MGKHKEEALKRLDYLRKGTDMYDSFLDYLREEVAKGGLSLVDISTSEEELASLAKISD